MKSNVEVPQQTKNRNTIKPSNSTSRNLPKENKIPDPKDIFTPIAALFTIAKIWKQPKCPSVDEWIKKSWCIYTIEYYSAIKRKDILPFGMKCMGLQGIMLSEILQTEKVTI